MIAIIYVILNVNADEFEFAPEIIIGIKNPFLKLKAVSISGYKLYANKNPGIKQFIKIPKLLIINLNIKMIIIRRENGIFFLYNFIISIVISNGD